MAIKEKRLIGLDKVVSNLNKEIAKIEGATAAGVLAAALYVSGEAVKNAPIDLGNLRASRFVTNGKVSESEGEFKGEDKSKFKRAHSALVNKSKKEAKQDKKSVMAIIGFSAFYAVFVHEINKNYKQGGWKFLEKALKDNSKKVLDIIRQYATIKG
jgi:glycerate kinase